MFDLITLASLAYGSQIASHCKHVIEDVVPSATQWQHGDTVPYPVFFFYSSPHLQLNSRDVISVWNTREKPYGISILFTNQRLPKFSLKPPA